MLAQLAPLTVSSQTSGLCPPGMPPSLGSGTRTSFRCSRGTVSASLNILARGQRRAGPIAGGNDDALAEAIGDVAHREEPWDTRAASDTGLDLAMAVEGINGRIRGQGQFRSLR